MEILAATQAEIEAANVAAGQDAFVLNDVTIKAVAESDPVKAERLRIQTIEKHCRGEWGPNAAKVAQLKAKAIEGGSLEELTSGLLEIVRADRPKGPGIHASQRDIGAEVIEAALCASTRVPNYEKDYSEQVLDSAHRAFRGRLGLQQCLIMAATANGYSMQPGERLHDGNLRTVLAFALPGPREIHAGGFSTTSLPGILSNVANKQLLSGYEEEDQTWREVADIKSVTDFKEATSYRMLDNLEYEEVGPAGKIPHGSTGEESYTRQAKTYAKMYSLTRTTIINDDLSAFDDLRKRLGRGAAKKFNTVFWARFLNNASFFTSARTNYIEGATTNLGTDGVGLALGEVAFRALKSSAADGAKRISGQPVLLLVPPELAVIARKLYASENFVGGSSNIAEANSFFGLYKPVVCDFLSDSAFTGYSATAWYLFRKPALLAPMVASFLNGNPTPTVESADADFDTLGIQLRGYHDFGCDFAEYLAGVKSKGAV